MDEGPDWVLAAIFAVAAAVVAAAVAVAFG